MCEYVCSEGQFPERTLRESSIAESNTFLFRENDTPDVDAKKTPQWMETVKSLVPSAFSGKVISIFRVYNALACLFCVLFCVLFCL